MDEALDLLDKLDNINYPISRTTYIAHCGHCGSSRGEDHRDGCFNLKCRLQNAKQREEDCRRASS